jgi:hypothetical protein
MARKLLNQQAKENYLSPEVSMNVDITVDTF